MCGPCGSCDPKPGTGEEHLQPGKFTIQIPDELMKRYGKSSSHMSALLKGARARQQGLTREACPYSFNKAASFYFAWSHGWIGVDSGTITFKEAEVKNGK
ncbi:MAG: hypothetical protein A2Y59_00570 [Chloroflexi bacterium RBG_13_52_14]|nr:MAG: hypothetical protein A2Y59_00570 [Chloroflexi bacterium RBG_13_52_14]